MKRYIFFIIALLPLLLLVACSKYTLDDGDSDKFNVYFKFHKNSNGDILDIDYPVRIFFVDKNSSNSTEFNFGDGESLIASIDEGEYAINTFIGMDDNFFIMNDISGLPIVSMRDNGISDRPLMAVHTDITIDKNTEINFIPTYIVSSIEIELDNIPVDIQKIHVEISPASCGYEIDGGYSDRIMQSVVDCYPKNNKWVSGQIFLFPMEGYKTVITVILDNGDSIKSYSYTLSEGFKQGQPYKITGGFDDEGELGINGNFQISGWNLEEEIVLDFENEISDDEGETDSGDSSIEDDVYFVDAFPIANSIWGPFYVWKVTEQDSDEAFVTLISPDQWFKIFKEGEAMELLEGYEIDGITGWSTFSRDEAEEFYKEFSDDLNALNTLLRENGHNIFYTENRYLCENGESAFNMFGGINIRPAGYTVKYHLRPVITIKLRKR